MECTYFSAGKEADPAVGGLGPGPGAPPSPLPGLPRSQHRGGQPGDGLQHTAQPPPRTTPTRPGQADTGGAAGHLRDPAVWA